MPTTKYDKYIAHKEFVKRQKQEEMELDDKIDKYFDKHLNPFNKQTS